MVDDVKIVQFKVWKKDVFGKVEIVKVYYDGSMYKVKVIFKEDGIYYIKMDINVCGEYIFFIQ